jgi:hypothetical protein
LAEVDTVAVARKQRHLHLLTKVKGNRPLSRKEIKELDELERAAKNKKGGRRAGHRLADGEVIVGQIEAAAFAGVAERTIRKWEKAGLWDGGGGRRKVYLKSQLLQFKEHEAHRPSKDRDRLLRAEADFKQARAKLAEVELKIKTGELLEREAVERGRVERIELVRQGLEILKRRVLTGLPRQARPKAKETINGAIERLCAIYGGDDDDSSA